MKCLECNKECAKATSATIYSCNDCEITYNERINKTSSISYNFTHPQPNSFIDHYSVYYIESNHAMIIYERHSLEYFYKQLLESEKPSKEMAQKFLNSTLSCKIL